MHVYQVAMKDGQQATLPGRGYKFDPIQNTFTIDHPTGPVILNWNHVLYVSETHEPGYVNDNGIGVDV